MRATLFTLAILAATLATATVAQATTLERLSMNDMTDKSHVVVRATVVNGVTDDRRRDDTRGGEDEPGPEQRVGGRCASDGPAPTRR